MEPKKLSSIRDVTEYLREQHLHVIRPSDNICQIIREFPMSAVAIEIDHRAYSEFAAGASLLEYFGEVSEAQAGRLASLVAEINGDAELPTLQLRGEMVGIKAPIYLDEEHSLSTRALTASIQMVRHVFQTVRPLAKAVYDGNEIARPALAPFVAPPYTASVDPIPVVDYDLAQIGALRLTTAEQARRYLPIPGDVVAERPDGFAMSLKPSEPDDLVGVRWDTHLGALRLQYLFDGSIVDAQRPALARKIEQVGAILSPRFVMRGHRLALETHLFFDDAGGLRVSAVGFALAHLGSALANNRAALSAFLS